MGLPVLFRIGHAVLLPNPRQETQTPAGQLPLASSRLPAAHAPGRRIFPARCQLTRSLS
jgi:hypothetical protein